MNEKIPSKRKLTTKPLYYQINRDIIYRLALMKSQSVKIKNNSI